MWPPRFSEAAIRRLLKEYFSVMGRRFGIFFEVFPYGKRMHEATDRFISGFRYRRHEKDEWLIQGNSDTFELTERGSLRQGRCSPNSRIVAKTSGKSGRAETGSRVTIVVHFILAALKLPAILSAV